MNASCFMCGAPADMVTEQVVSPLTPAGVLVLGGPQRQSLGMCAGCLRQHGEPVADMANRAAKRRKFKGSA
jgi:hypothetical protein